MVRLIITLIIIGIMGGAIAYLGNQLGRYIGRKKLSIFRLRPRHTSILITTLTGVFIATGTLLFAYISSWEVKTLFEGLNEYRAKVTNEYIKDAEQAEVGGFGAVFTEREPILTAIIDGSQGLESTEAQLKEIIAYANQAAIIKSNQVAESMDTEFTPPADERLVGYIPDELKSLAYSIDKQKKKYVVMVYAMSYAFLGEKFPAGFFIVDYKPKVFAKNEEIIRGKIDGAGNKSEMLMALSKLIIQAKGRALKKGMIENPKTNQLGKFDRQEYIDTLDKIAESRKINTVVIKSRDDVDNRGPLNIYFELQ